MSKGSRARPCKVTSQERDLRYQLIFGKTQKEKDDALVKLKQLGFIK